MGYKVWADQEILEADDLNQHLMKQCVPRFATEAIRSAAIPIPERGQMSYVYDLGLQIFEDDAWTSVGGTP